MAAYYVQDAFLLLTGAMSRKWPSSVLGETYQEANFWAKLMQPKVSGIYTDLEEKEMFKVNVSGTSSSAF